MEELTVVKIREMLESGEITSRQLVLNYMERIALIDKSGPMLNSVLELNPDALYIAKAMDRERAKGKLRSPLHGIPILIKDNINTHDKIRTSAGYDDENMPFGLTFIGRPFSEPMLIKAAYAYEQATHERKVPVFDI